ncbi:MAG: DUF5362 domain-containing protein [Treponema sp.]|nr:DUF5362 domain-containing protein [Treponema sp.]MCL2272854.1 DUF5362 domain-containing protein [Treponema sp.]
MSDNENPYQSPESPIIPVTSQSSDNSITPLMLKYLNETSPWLRFVGILGYILCGFLVILGIIIAASSTVAASLLGNDLENFPIWIIGFLYIPLALLLFFPSHYTFKFGQKIKNYQFSSSNDDLENAFKNNKSLWKFYGILMIIYLAIFPVIIVVSIIIGVASATSGLF